MFSCAAVMTVDDLFWPEWRYAQQPAKLTLSLLAELKQQNPDFFNSEQEQDVAPELLIGWTPDHDYEPIHDLNESVFNNADHDEFSSTIKDDHPVPQPTIPQTDGDNTCSLRRKRDDESADEVLPSEHDPVTAHTTTTLSSSRRSPKPLEPSVIQKIETVENPAKQVASNTRAIINRKDKQRVVNSKTKARSKPSSVCSSSSSSSTAQESPHSYNTRATTAGTKHPSPSHAAAGLKNAAPKAHVSKSPVAKSTIKDGGAPTCVITSSVAAACHSKSHGGQNLQLILNPGGLRVICVVLKHQGTNGRHADPSKANYLYYQARMKNVYPQKHLWSGWELKDRMADRVLDEIKNKWESLRELFGEGIHSSLITILNHEDSPPPPPPSVETSTLGSQSTEGCPASKRKRMHL